MCDKEGQQDCNKEALLVNCLKTSQKKRSKSTNLQTYVVISFFSHRNSHYALNFVFLKRGSPNCESFGSVRPAFAGNKW